MSPEETEIPLRRRATAVVRFALDIVLPPQCLACDTPVLEQGGLCSGCWTSLAPITRPFCERLGTPLPFDLGEGAVSAEAIAEPPPFGRCRAVAVYGDKAAGLVHRLKYADRPELARWMGGWMARSGEELLGPADLIVPVPLHRRRLWSRRYNQAAVLTQAIGERSGVPVGLDVLARRKATRQQVGLTSAQRETNVRGAFQAGPEVRGKRVVLVDDVYTTGATIRAATRCLLRAGAVSVDVLVFATVVREAV